MNNSFFMTLVKKPLSIGLVVFLLVLALTQYLAFLQYLINEESEQEEIRHELNLIQDRLKTSLSYNLSATKTLAFIIKNYGIPKDFDGVAAQIISSNKNIDALQLTQKGIITHVYPLKGNESVIGYDILNNPLTNKEALKSIDKGELFFAGPFPLKQGGMGVVGRLPIMINDEFWGFSAVVIKLSTLIAATGIDTLQSSRFVYQLSKTNPNTGTEEFFLKHSFPSDKKNAASISLDEGGWTLYVALKDGRSFVNILVLSLIGFGFSFISGLFAWHLARQPEKLNRLVKEKTAQLIRTQNNYQITLDRVSDAFVALDENWCYTYINNKAGELFARNPQKMIGKHIWTEFPEGIDQPFYKAYHKAMETQEYISLEEYYPAYDKWFENHIYPSTNGLTIYFKDVTERKKAEQKILREKNFSQSIINSLPGIFYLYDRNGKFIQWNNNFELVSGYNSTEISRMHPLDFFDEEEKDLLQQRIALVFTEGKAEVEAHFFTKTKQKIPFYFNGHMVNFDGIDYLLGVGIDISERKRAEDLIRKSQAELRQLTAHLQTIREEERTSIAREIHDELGQQLTVLKMDVSWLTKKLAPEETAQQDKLKGMLSLIDDTVKTVRRISSDLRPGILDDLGLIAALEWQSHEFEKRTGIRCVFESEINELTLEKDIATGVFRIYQEALTNVLRHAQASWVKAKLRQTKDVATLSIQDNGQGFDTAEAREKNTLGLTGMSERALMFKGNLSLNSKKGEGTLVVLEIPLISFSI